MSFRFSLKPLTSQYRSWSNHNLLAPALAATLLMIVASAADAQYRIDPLVGQAQQSQTLRLVQEGWQLDQGDPLPWQSVRSITFPRTGSTESESESPATSRWQVGLAGGGHLGVSQVAFDGQSVEVSGTLGTTTLPIECLTSLRKDDLPSDKLPQALLDEDQLVVKVEGQLQTVAGLLESIDESGIAFSSDAGSGEIPFERIAGLVMASAGAVTSDAGVLVQLHNGDAVFGQPLSDSDQKLELDLFGLGQLGLARSLIKSIHTTTPRLKYLSQLEPLSERTEGLLLNAKPWQRDRSVLGQPLALRLDEASRAVTTFPHGLGLASFTELTFDVDGFDHFATWAGIHAEAQGQGSCELVIQIDSQEVWRQTLTAGAAAIPIELPLDDARRLTLTLSAGDRLDLGDHVDLADARLVKTSE